MISPKISTARELKQTNKKDYNLFIFRSEISFRRVLLIRSAALEQIGERLSRWGHAELCAELIEIARQAEESVVACGERCVDAESVRGAELVVRLVACAHLEHGRETCHRAVVLERGAHESVVEFGHAHRLFGQRSLRRRLLFRRCSCRRCITLFCFCFLIN